MPVERKELFMPLTEEGRRDVLNCAVRGMTIRRMQQIMDWHNANISLAAGAINDPDMGSLPVNENNMHAFELDPLWEVMPDGKTAMDMYNDLKDLLIDSLTEVEKADDPGETSIGNICVAINEECNE